MFTVAVRAADPGEAGARMPAVEIALDDLLDDRPEMTELLLNKALVDCQDPVEVMEQHPIEDRALRLARTGDSRHAGRADSRSMPRLPRGRIGGKARNRSTTGYASFYSGVSQSFCSLIMMIRSLQGNRPIQSRPGGMESSRPFFQAVLKLFPDDAAEERPKVLTASLDVFPEGAIDHRLITAAALGVNLVTKPIKDLVIQPYRDPGFPGRRRKQGASLAFAEVIEFFHSHSQ
jgi:hypothetical protein